MIFFLAGVLCFSCTSIIVTKGASADGSVIITYSCDGEFFPRLRLYPAADHKPGEMVEIMGFRGKRGQIREVAHTYKVLDLMNEFLWRLAKRLLIAARNGLSGGVAAGRVKRESREVPAERKLRVRKRALKTWYFSLDLLLRK